MSNDPGTLCSQARQHEVAKAECQAEPTLSTNVVKAGSFLFPFLQNQNLFLLGIQKTPIIPFPAITASGGPSGTSSSSAAWKEHPSEACFKRSGSALLNCCIRCRTTSAARGLEGLGTIAVRQGGGGWELLLGAASEEKNIHMCPF